MKTSKNARRTRKTPRHAPTPSKHSTFDVLVLATMSAGKSSFINALIGQELLHAANEATTACITSVSHNPDAEHFSGACFSYTNRELSRHEHASAQLLRDWNANQNVKRINLNGNFSIVPSPPKGLVLHDTPGPNNSQDDQHAQLMLEAVRTIDFNALCYVLNASQLATQDDRAFLQQLQKELQGKSQPIYFILNKVDLLDPDRGESVERYVDSAHRYLISLGFAAPMIIPTTAITALYARKSLRKEPLSFKQRLWLEQALDELEENKRALLHAAAVPQAVKHHGLQALSTLEAMHSNTALDQCARERNALLQLVAVSGLNTVETLLKRQSGGHAMNTILIKHNPFTVDTSFLINDQPPAEGCKLSSYKESRLQVWVETLFDELDYLFNGDNRYAITFNGVESDYLDIVEAAGIARDKGMQIELSWVPTQETENRLLQIRQLMDEARQHPQFERFINSNDEISRSFEEAFNRDFDVYVVATMSSGKSTLINAMLGRDLLPAANEATTATIARITDNTTMGSSFTARRLTDKEIIVDSDDDVTLDTLKAWNAQPDTFRIDLEGNIQAFESRDSVRLVLTDTPGPNNSQDAEHQRTTMGFIQDSTRNPLILYVLNAGQLATCDDRNLLGLVAESMCKGGKQSKDRFIFVINKVDDYDPEKEDLPGMLNRVSTYLSNNGIQNPLVYPISAELARLIRKPQDTHTAKERSRYKGMADFFTEEASMNLLQYMPVTSRVKQALHAKRLSPLLQSSGLPAVETMIDEYIDKYNFPHRLKRAYDAMTKAIEVGLNEAELIEQLQVDERALRHTNEEIEALTQRQQKGFDTAAYKDKVTREGKALPEATEIELKELERSIDQFLKKQALAFGHGQTTVSAAKAKIEELEQQFQFLHKKLINAYENVFVSSQNAIRQDLEHEYKRYILDLFKGTEHLHLPILEGIKKTVGDISFNLGVKGKEIKQRDVVIGSYEVSDSTWYNPFSWGSTRTVKQYATEDYVNLGDLWKERATVVETQLSILVDSARDHIETGKNRLIDQFLAFMNQEFDTRFNELMTSLQEKMQDKHAREHAIEQAKQLHAWISAFKAKLDNTLAV